MERNFAAKFKKALCAAAAIIMMLIACVPTAAYAAADSAEISVNQIFTASDSDAGASFAYILEPHEKGNPMPAGSANEGYRFTITGTDSVIIDLAPFSVQGVYRYKLFQVVDTEKPGYTYDSRVYTIEVYVISGPDVKVVVLNEDGDKAATITFQNIYGVLPSDPDLMADTPVRKTVFGSPGRDRTFEFKLVAENSSNPMPPGSEAGVKTISVTGSGRNEFGVWSYTKAGTYYYKVYEVNAGAAGYTYDTAVYTITDMVRAENGQLVVSRIVTNDTNRPVTSFIFNNYYSGGETVSPPTTTPPTTTPPTTTPPTEPPVTELPPTEPPTTEFPPTEPPVTELPTTEPPTTEFPPTDPPATNIPPTNPPGGGKDGGAGPKTGDDSNNGFYIGLLASGAAVSISAAICLITICKRERRRMQI